MHKPVFVIKWSAPTTIIMAAQLFVLCALCMSLISVGLTSSSTISLLPPSHHIYQSASVGWIGNGRITGHTVVAIMNAITGAMCIWYGYYRKLKPIKLVTLTMGVQFLMSAALNAGIAVLVAKGGYWHLAGFVLVTGMVLSAAATSVVFVILQAQLTELGIALDRYIINGRHEHEKAQQSPD